jgi:hypothetical protein
MAAKNAAQVASKSPRDSAGQARQDLNRFDHLDVPRFFTEVNVQGYDVAKSVSSQKKKLQMRMRAEQRKRADAQPVPEPVELASKSSAGAKRARRKANECADGFQLQL